MNAPTSRALLALPFAALLAAAAPRSSRQDRSEVVVTDTLVAGSVHMLTGAGGNIGLSVGADGLLMIDDQFEDLAPKIRAAIEHAAGSAVSPRWLVNTHFHGDHTGGNAVFGAAATVVAHDNVRARLLAPKSGKPMAAPGLPLVTFSEQCSLHVNGEDVRLIHMPRCHTDGDTVAHFRASNVWHLGDLFFNGRFPFVDLGAGGSVVGLERALRALLAEIPGDAKLIPGHGALATRTDLERYHAMIADSIALVTDALEHGKGMDEIVGDATLAKYDAWSWSFISRDTFTKTLVNELSASVTERR
ncbi:MAG: MBL fold metallo-hydrolase [Planctomycetes bacterium]|nr:MBL fold metallo-hydrolase [Planctomycetota bacterium]